MTQLVCDFDLQVVSECGSHKIPFKANQPREVPDVFYALCRQKGAFPPGGLKQPTLEAQESKAKEPLVEQAVLVEVIKGIFATGDAALLDNGGVPRMSAIKKRVDGAVSKGDVVGAMALIDFDDAGE